MGNSNNGKITKQKESRDLPYSTVICKFCPEFTTMSPEKEDRHMLRHSIDALNCSPKAMAILDSIFHNVPTLGSEDFLPIANEILTIFEEKNRLKLIDCMQLVT